MGAGNVELTEYHATVAKKLLRSGSLVSRHTNGLPAEELEAVNERGCRATARSYRTNEIVCELDSSSLLTSLRSLAGYMHVFINFLQKSFISVTSF